MADKRRLCGAIDEIEYGVWFECELPMHHPGDEHQAVHVWQNKPHGPEPHPALNAWLRPLWAKALEQAYTRQLLVRPVEPRTLVANRDGEG